VKQSIRNTDEEDEWQDQSRDQSKKILSFFPILFIPGFILFIRVPLFER